MKQFNQLKTKQRQLRAGFSENLSLRVHRALSWLQRSEACDDDPDGEFIFLWIAFNAAYANDMDAQYRGSELDASNRFLTRLCQLDPEQRLSALVWQQYPGPIRVLLDNQHVFQPFWDHLNGKPGSEQWQQQFSEARHQAAKALSQQNTPRVLAIALQRIYTLRNQLVHGGATWNSQLNRQQLRDCCAILRSLVPIVIDIMMDNADQIWGDPFYPVVAS
ncbi:MULTISPECIES: HEPN domain-containing protein [Ferrimonas]|uniref:HEPN domain-containing protein n=1 Tax=Ferrimonas TaxID=44011 RepID=UPI0003FE991E|nr:MULTISPECIES: HEPN domain-containing protein [Ferrimonas]USD36460.1 hypothetical protein J8Z22_15745 [Ferrimonas sp. SCSIO 43195]